MTTFVKAPTAPKGPLHISWADHSVTIDDGEKVTPETPDAARDYREHPHLVEGSVPSPAPVVSKPAKPTDEVTE